MKKQGIPGPYYDFIQNAGETVFIPGGWHHGVLNLEDSVAVTQNFCSSINFPQVWRKTRKGRKRMAVTLLHELKTACPELAKVANELNAQDDYTMYVRSTQTVESIENKKTKKKKKRTG